MILEGKQVSVESSRMKDSVDFTAEIDGMMFDNLINGIYSNKMAAGIREYATNARDGHARAGNLDKPFDVSLPTRSNPTFEVRDYGSSLTHKDVFEVYTVLGKSTKRDTNEETGCLGLGSKSAFAYTNTFTVSCFKDGEKRDYVCYIAEDGRPKASLMSTTKTREANGVRISYAVKQDDIEAFNKEATQQLRGFKPQPNVLRHTDSYKPLNKDNLLLSGDDWEMYKAEEEVSYYSYRTNGKPYAIQGSVAYPIEWTNQALQSAVNKLPGVKKNRVSALLQKTNVLIRFELGQLRMTTSREELAYDEKTCNNIAEKCAEIIDSIQSKLDEEYAKCKSMKEARILLSKNKSDNGMSSIDSILDIRQRYWNGNEIEDVVEIISNNHGSGELSRTVSKSYWGGDELRKPSAFRTKYDVQFRIEEEHNYRNEFGEMKATFKWKDLTGSTTRVHKKLKAHRVSDMYVIVDVEPLVTGNRNSLMRRFWHDHIKGQSEFMWIKASTKSEAKRFLEAIYHDQKNVWYLHELEELKMVKTQTMVNGVQINSDTEKQFRVIYGATYVYSSEPNKYKKVDSTNPPPNKIPVVWFKQNEFFWTEQDMNDGLSVSHQDMARVIEEWVGRSDAVYVVNGLTKTFYEANKKLFTPAKEWMIGQYKKNNPTWEADFIDRNQNSNASSEREWASKFSQIKKSTQLSFPKVSAAVSSYEKNKEANKYGTYRTTRYGSDGLPLMANVWLKDKVEELKKKAQSQNLKTPCLDYVESDAILKYLVKQWEPYRNNEDLVLAITQWHKENT